MLNTPSPLVSLGSKNILSSLLNRERVSLLSCRVILGWRTADYLVLVTGFLEMIVSVGNLRTARKGFLQL